MGLGTRFAKLLRRERHMHAVWPLTASLAAVGDYGAFDDGVFVRLGHIDEFGVDFEAAATPCDELMNVRSDGMTITRLQGGMPVAAFSPSIGGDATLSIECENEYSFLFRAVGVSAREMTSRNEVARRLSRALGWKKGLFRWSVVGKVFACKQYLLLASRETKTTFEFSGEASLLAAFEMNQGLGIGLDTQANKSMALEQRGKAGPIGLELFQVSMFGNEAVRKKGAAAEPTAAAEETVALPREDWSGEFPVDWS